MQLLYCIMIQLLFIAVILCNGRQVTDNENEFHKYLNESLYEDICCDTNESNHMIWSEVLEDYIVNKRQSRDMLYENDMMGSQVNQQKFAIMINSDNQQQPNQHQSFNYHSSIYNRPPVYINKRIGEIAVEMDSHKRPQPVHPQLRPMVKQTGLLQQIFGIGSNQHQHTVPMRPLAQTPPHSNMHSNHQQPIRTISENDLYLLGAIEKLVYRVDYLESRVRRTEQLIYYLMAGNNQKDDRDPCPSNFTRINDNCYHFNIYQEVNWKTANTACKALNSHLVEFERNSEYEEIIAYLLNQPSYRRRDFWLGALNPGLLWIWSTSAKPVNPNTNLTSIAMGQLTNKTIETNIIDNSNLDENQTEKDEIEENEISNKGNFVTGIKGNGRCLRLTYNNSRHSYDYYGQECTSRHHFICEFEDNTLTNKIKKIARNLKL